MMNKNRIVNEFCELVKIDSPSYKEREMADCMTNKLKEIGFTVIEDDAATKIGGNSGNFSRGIEK